MKRKDYKILIVDDDLDYAGTCAKVIAGGGFSVSAVQSATEALIVIESEHVPHLVITDLKMPETDGLQLLREVKSRNSSIEVIIMTGYGTIKSAVQAIKYKAIDYVTKPFDKEELLNAVGKVYRVWKLQSEIAQLKRQVSEKLQLDGYVFKNAAMGETYSRLESAARCDCSVFITGESGTGKELIARAVHRNSHRKNRPFVPINCSTLSGQLVESELFGYRKGAFTGADQDYPGLFVAADGGTLFLDEITEMPVGTQAKLLRAIQEKSIRPVGSVEERKVDVRFITATNADVDTALAKKQVREDLYYRLNVIRIEMQPLRKMRDEIAGLFNYFITCRNRHREHIIDAIDNSALLLLQDYAWPGNIREAENMVARWFAEATSTVIGIKDVARHVAGPGRSPMLQGESVPSFSDAERDLVVRALQQAKGNKSKAAEILGISRPRLYKKIEIYNIN